MTAFNTRLIRKSLKYLSLFWHMISWSVVLFGGVLAFLIWGVFLLIPIVLAVLVLVCLIACLSFPFVTRKIFTILKGVMPSLSQTEQEVLEAGHVGWEKELLSGDPQWSNWRDQPVSPLTAEEQAFLEGPVEDLCAQIDDWVLSHHDRCIPKELLAYMGRTGFWSFIIPKQYGGLEFSPMAQARVIAKVASVSTACGVIVSVPNSLGPGELLLHYGTEEQKDYYLPRLARGEEIPCFALTSPYAGSDANALIDHGVVCHGEHEGEQVLGIRLNWDKRYITLSPVATLIGLAFKLYDPDHLLSEQEERGMTCALIKRETPGISIGRRHYPLCSSFPNGPIQGKDVFIPMSWVIGEVGGVGRGWQMLMSCLAAGRGISLPSMVAGGSVRALWATGGYVQVRHQFDLPIARFGGVQEAMARMVGYGYIIQAMRAMTMTMLTEGVQSAVISAICKCHATELGRRILVDAMDIHGGRGICMGPKNYLAQAHIEGPISITVEGANILTRSMIIFGQGILRCHPFLYDEVQLLQKKATEKGVISQFRRLFLSHARFFLRSGVRAWSMGWRDKTVLPDDPITHHYRHLTRFSTALAWVSDWSLVIYGGQLKMNEQVSARLGDVISHLYMAGCVLRYYDSQKEDELMPIVDWVMAYHTHEIENHLWEWCENLPRKRLGRFIRAVIFPKGRTCSRPSDKLGTEVAALLSEPAFRETLKEEIVLSGYGGQMQQYEDVLAEQRRLKSVHDQVRRAARKAHRRDPTWLDTLQWAKQEGLITESEYDGLEKVYQMSMALIHVDDFAHEELSGSVY